MWWIIIIGLIWWFWKDIRAFSLRRGQIWIDNSGKRFNPFFTEAIKYEVLEIKGKWVKYKILSTGDEETSLVTSFIKNKKRCR